MQRYDYRNAERYCVSNQKEHLKIPYEKVRAIIKKDMNPKELEDFILKALTDYQRKLTRQQQNRDAR